MATVEELTEVDDPAWPLVESWIHESPRTVEVLGVSAPGEVLLRLQVSVRSVLGALAWHTGGMLLDHGWLRVLGGGAPLLSALEPGPGLLVTAYDVLGGRFAIDAGGLTSPGEMHYFAPDSLAWEPLGVGHAEWVGWALTGDLPGFYADFRWPGWEDEVSSLPPHEGLSLVPPPYTAEGRDLAVVSRRPVPVETLFALYDELGA